MTEMTRLLKRIKKIQDEFIAHQLSEDEIESAIKLTDQLGECLDKLEALYDTEYPDFKVLKDENK